MSFWVYILACADKSYYVGQTDKLSKRLAEHQSGALGGYTSARLPVRLKYSQAFPSREQAFAVERQLKGWSRKKKEALIRGDWESLRILARGRSRRDAHPSTSSG
jgi:predicted GIY-YIG superfamily endonuclease